MEMALAAIAIVLLLYGLMKFRKHTSESPAHRRDAAGEASYEWDDELRERMLVQMRKFLELEKGVLPEIMYDRMRCGDRGSRYFAYAHDREKLQRVFEMEDKRIADELKKRQDRIRDIIAVIENTGKWPKTISEIYGIMTIELK